MVSLGLPDLVAPPLEHLHGKADMGKRIAELAGQVCRYARLMQYARYDISSGIAETHPDRPPQKHRATMGGTGKLVRFSVP